jgi:2-polyprenyl-3-methyl-5-hydroxy-6-metoxy-1,4-benzoquinol methylase
MDLNACPVCTRSLKLKYKLKFDVYKCAGCGLYVADACFNHSFSSNVDTAMRSTGLQQLRTANFELIIEEIKRLYQPNSTNIKGLEIGCGNGWWLAACKKNGIDCAGIEPETSFKRGHQENGFEVTYGFYPDKKDTTKYDFVIFNDVFEHIPDVNSLAASVNADLKENGYLIINIPLSDGLFSQCARVFNKLGIKSFLNRMWQFDFHSPHYTYFNAENLNQLVSKHGFTKISEFRLNTLDFDHIKERVSTDKKVSRVTVAMAALLKGAKPLINAAKPDIKVFFFKKTSPEC